MLNDEQETTLLRQDSSDQEPYFTTSSGGYVKLVANFFMIGNNALIELFRVQIQQ